MNRPSAPGTFPFLLALSLLLGATITTSLALGGTAGSAVAQPVPDQTSTVTDPVGDTLFNAPAFQDFVFARMTKTASGDFYLLMELAGPLPVNPPMPPPARAEIWWFWGFDLDPTTFPQGYPTAPGGTALPEFLVYVSWDGTAFAGTAIDRRPLLTGGEAIVYTVEFSISSDRTIVEAIVPSGLSDDFPASFPWKVGTTDWSGPLGSAGWFSVDFGGTVFNP